MSPLLRASGLLVLLLAVAVPAASGANQKDIDRAVKGGVGSLKAKYARPVVVPLNDATNHGIGPTCLSGLALLEAGVPANDPSIKNITGMVREAAYTQTATYQI